jgi:AraC family transcriptional regulator
LTINPLQFVTRERITPAQQLMRETSRSIIDVALEVGYTSPSHFTKVFRRVTGVAPNEFTLTAYSISPEPGLLQRL